MKRSQAINLIKLYTEKYFGMLTIGDITDRFADNLLKQLEKDDMSPPEYLPEPQYCEVTGKQLEVKPVRKWEKE